MLPVVALDSVRCSDTEIDQVIDKILIAAKDLNARMAVQIGPVGMIIVPGESSGDVSNRYRTRLRQVNEEILQHERRMASRRKIENRIKYDGFERRANLERRSA